MKQIIPYFTMDNCAEAVSFYQTVFGGEILHASYGKDVPGFEKFPNKLIHAELHIAENLVLFFNDLQLGEMTHGNTLIIGLECDSNEELLRYMEILQIGGRVEMEVANMFWGATHAKVEDKFGYMWELNYTHV
ncbi:MULTISPECIES: VOC family protein [Listeria]|uniref:VOC family protein n=1 Tax=Listeria TaxID=1637 RepID=UPI000B591653|nr:MULTISPECIES: VOC family protein [Listeria]